MVNTLDDSFVTEGTWKPNLFKGKVVLVTGGAGSICRVQTEAMVLLGAQAAIIGRRKEATVEAAEEISKLGEEGCVLPVYGVDVRNFEEVKDAVAQTVAKFGRIDYVIAGAAGNFISDFQHLSPNGFKSVVDIDLLGSFNTAKACVSELQKTKGAIIFISATLHYYGVPFQAHVGAAKAGVDALSNALAVELGPLGIRCNCIAPGPIGDTEGLKRLVQSGLKDKLITMVPLQRLGKREDVANTTVFLFSSAASFVNGSISVVDGGAWHIGTHFAQDMYPEFVKGLKSQL